MEVPIGQGPGVGAVMRRRILVAESRGFSRQAAAILSEFGELALADLGRAELEQAIGAAAVLWVRLRHYIDEALLRRAPDLEIIATPTTGLTHIDTAAVARRGIRLVSLRGETEFLRDVRATAEHTLGLILALLRHIPAAAAHTAAGGWDRDRFQGTEIYGKTAGVAGYGRLGRIVARYLLAFGARVLAADPYGGDVEPGVERVELEELLRESDIVSLHVSLCDETREFFGRREFARMKPGSIFINTARGELVDETALADAVRSGRLAGAALDVVSGEHPGEARRGQAVAALAALPNVLITPHIGGCTVESMEKTEIFLAGQVAELLARECSVASQV